MLKFEELWKKYESPGVLLNAKGAANITQAIKSNRGDTSAYSYENECLKKIKEDTLKAATRGCYHAYIRFKAYNCPEGIPLQEKNFLKTRVYHKIKEYLESLEYEVDYFYDQKNSIVVWDISW